MTSRTELGQGAKHEPGPARFAVLANAVRIVDESPSFLDVLWSQAHHGQRGLEQNPCAPSWLQQANLRNQTTIQFSRGSCITGERCSYRMVMLRASACDRPGPPTLGFDEELQRRLVLTECH